MACVGGRGSAVHAAMRKADGCFLVAVASRGSSTDKLCPRVPATGGKMEHKRRPCYAETPRYASPVAYTNTTTTTSGHPPNIPDTTKESQQQSSLRPQHSPPPACVPLPAIGHQSPARGPLPSYVANHRVESPHRQSAPPPLTALAPPLRPIACPPPSVRQSILAPSSPAARRALALAPGTIVMPASPLPTDCLR